MVLLEPYKDSELDELNKILSDRDCQSLPVQKLLDFVVSSNAPVLFAPVQGIEQLISPVMLGAPASRY